MSKNVPDGLGVPSGAQAARDLSDTSWETYGPGQENPFDGTRDLSPVNQGHELELARRGDPPLSS